MLFLLLITCHAFPFSSVPSPSFYLHLFHLFLYPSRLSSSYCSSPLPHPPLLSLPPSASCWAADGRRRCFLTSDTEYFLPPPVDDDTRAACQWSGGGVKDTLVVLSAGRGPSFIPTAVWTDPRTRVAGDSVGETFNSLASSICFLVVPSGKEKLRVTRHQKQTAALSHEEKIKVCCRGKKMRRKQLWLL